MNEEARGRWALHSKKNKKFNICNFGELHLTGSRPPYAKITI